MVKVALLIGVSEYQPSLPPLPGVEEDINKMQRVLRNLDICGFDEVKTLLNCDRQVMEEEIEQLFSNCEKNDLVLLYFSGHGIKDESGQLYFASSITRKDEQGKLLKATAVEARVVQRIMSNSRSKRQVVILDCCFSGAFAQGMQGKDDGLVDIKNQLGGEGRAILTSSTSTQYSLDSIYTRYIVEGLETGAADIDNDGEVSVEELHEYTKQQVQEAAPAMKPEIYPIREGYKIILAKIRNDPELRYRKTVERLFARGEISDTGRRILNALGDSLGLLVSKTQEIETEVLQPFITHKKNLSNYEQAYLEAVGREHPISEHTRNELKDLQQVLGLRDADIAIIPSRIITEKQTYSEPQKQRRNSRILRYFSYIGVLIIGGAVVYVVRPPQPMLNFCAKEDYISDDRISFGEKILFKQDSQTDKEAGIEAFAQSDCLTAINKLKADQAVNPSDPEALIYLNNAKARQQINRLKIAVVVPIGESPNIAKEMLRGVAQAQNEVNNNIGINGKALEVVIANDDNDPNIASNIATKFVRYTDILAVVGHNASRASLAASLVYQNGGLVMISPTSYAQNITSIGKYIFLTSPSASSIVDLVSHYAINTKKKTNFLICADQNVDNVSVKNSFIKAITKNGGTINPTNCDIDDSQFNPATVLSQARDKGADSLVLALYVDKSRDKSGKSHALLRANQSQLALFGTPALYTEETLEEGQNVNDIIASVPWYPGAFPRNPFEKNAENLWKVQVNWRTATSYDASRSIIKGLQQSNTRDQLQKTLHSPNFSVDGATGRFWFLQSGNRENNKKNSVFPVKVQLNHSTKKYEFVFVNIK